MFYLDIIIKGNTSLFLFLFFFYFVCLFFYFVWFFFLYEQNGIEKTGYMYYNVHIEKNEWNFHIIITLKICYLYKRSKITTLSVNKKQFLFMAVFQFVGLAVAVRANTLKLNDLSTPIQANHSLKGFSCAESYPLKNANCVVLF